MRGKITSINVLPQNVSTAEDTVIFVSMPKLTLFFQDHVMYSSLLDMEYVKKFAEPDFRHQNSAEKVHKL